MDARGDDAAGIRAVIDRQFEAFDKDDFVEAFGYASPGIRRVFETPEGFAAMIEHGYPMVQHPSETRFLELREIGGALWQKVLVRDEGGVFHVLDYKMIMVGGAWRIDGVQYLREAEMGA
jgi:hypothetical protein